MCFSIYMGILWFRVVNAERLAKLGIKEVAKMLEKT